MDVTVKFLGAGGSVTGSRYLIDLGDFEFLVDCGLFQGRRELRERNWDKLPMSPDEMESIILNYNHLDHIGSLPRLVKQGFKGPIYCTEATAGLAKILLLDSEKLQEEEAEFARKKGYSRQSILSHFILGRMPKLFFRCWWESHLEMPLLFTIRWRSLITTPVIFWAQPLSK